MSQNQDENFVYKISSLLFSLLVIFIILFDVGKKYFQQNIRIFTVESPILFPFLLVLILLVAFILELGVEIKNSRINDTNKRIKSNINQNSIERNQRKELFSIFVFTIISLTYIYLLPILHFNLATSLFMFFIMIVVNKSDGFGYKLVKALIATGVTIPIIYYIFYGVFDVILP